MSKLRAFTLIELLIVLVIIGAVSFLVVSFNKPSSYSALTPDKLYDFLHPEGEIYMFENGRNLVVLEDKNLSDIQLNMNVPEVYVYKFDRFEKKMFNDFENKRVVFHYVEKKGVGESFILKTDKGYYVFKPFEIIKADSFEEAKNLFFLDSYRYKEGEVY